MKNRVKLLIIACFSMFSLMSCVSVEAYQKMYLNDADMALSTRKIQSLEESFLLYREGAAGANGGKSGGGCGCN